MAELVFDIITLPASQLIGIAGFLCYLGSFAALQFRLIDGNGVLYSLLNILAAALLLISLMEAFNLASVLIQVSWIVIGLTGLGLRLWRSGLMQANLSPGFHAGARTLLGLRKIR